MAGETTPASNYSLSVFDQLRIFQLGLNPRDQVCFAELKQIGGYVGSLFLIQSKVRHSTLCIVAMGTADPRHQPVAINLIANAAQVRTKKFSFTIELMTALATHRFE